MAGLICTISYFAIGAVTLAPELLGYLGLGLEMVGEALVVESIYELTLGDPHNSCIGKLISDWYPES